jgi:hypothetical protein
VELVKTKQVLEKNKVSTALNPAKKGGITTSQTLLICVLKVLTKPTPSMVQSTKEIEQNTP